MQYEQHYPGKLYRALSRWLPGLLLVAVPLLAIVAGWAGEAHSAPSTPTVDAELGVPVGAALLSVPVGSPPTMDGVVETAWHRAPPLAVSLHYGLHGSEPAGTLELRSMYDAGRVYFLARWPAAIPGGEPDAWRNLLTVHWRLVDPGLVSGQSTASSGLACTVACHTVTVDGQGHVVRVRTETIPPGLDVDLPHAGGWAEGTWTVEWSRARTSESPYDQRMIDTARGYRFFVKLFQGVEGRADPVSDVHELWLSH
jgi:hypothetical protein